MGEVTDTQRLLLRLCAGEHTRGFTWHRTDYDALAALGFIEWSPQADEHRITDSGRAFLKKRKAKVAVPPQDQSEKSSIQGGSNVPQK